MAIFSTGLKVLLEYSSDVSYCPSGRYQMGDVQANSWVTFGASFSHSAGRSLTGKSTHCRQLQRNDGTATARIVGVSSMDMKVAETGVAERILIITTFTFFRVGDKLAIGVRCGVFLYRVVWYFPRYRRATLRRSVAAEQQ